MNPAGQPDIRDVRVAYLCLQTTIPGQASFAHVHEIIDGLRDLGAHVDLFEPDYQGQAPGAFGRLLEFKDLNDRTIEALGSYDLLYVRGHAFARRASKEALTLGIPVIQECNGPVDDFFIAWPAARAVAPLIKSWTLSQFEDATCLIAGSEGLAGWLKRTCDRDAAVIPNGANVELFSPADASQLEATRAYLRDRGIELPPAYAIFFGSLAPWQGVDTMLEAASSPEWPQGVDLVIVGSGKLSAEVERAAHENARIHHIPELPYDRIGGVVSGAICSLVVKEQEKFATAGISPLKLYESLACGVPVIATTKMPGLTEVVEREGVGLLVEQHDATALARAVATLAGDDGLVRRMGEKARTFAVESCSWKARAADTALVIEEALRRQRT